MNLVSATYWLSEPVTIHQAPLLTVDHDEASHVLIFKPLDGQSMTAFVSNLWHHLQQHAPFNDAQLHSERVVLCTARSFHIALSVR
jgi:hypothetical protein